MLNVLPLHGAPTPPLPPTPATQDARELLPAAFRLAEQRPAGPSRFFRAPRSGAELAAALAEPGVIVGMLYGLHALQGVPFERVAIVASLLVVTLTYPGRNRFSDRPAAALSDIVISWLSLLGLLMLFAYASRSVFEIPLAVVVPWIALTPVAQFAVTVLGGAWVRRGQRHSVATRHAVIIGGGPQGAQAAQAIAQRQDVPADVVGFFDDRDAARLEPAVAARLLGSMNEAARYVEKLGIRDVYICLPMASQARVTKLLDELQGTTASLYFVPDVVGISVVQGRLADVNGLPVVGICDTPFTGINAISKRISDIVLSLLILLLAAPLMLAIAVAVKLSSPGPILFRQRRNGLDGEEIFIYKFRSMRVAEEGPYVRQATRDDARVTRVGRLLRRTSLDELPQFFNVLQGRMSIVGPRPHAVVHNEMYRHLIKGYMVRHKARPGITGWAQINGYRGETETVVKMKDRTSLDLEYLRNWSLPLDLAIMWRTLRLVISDARAY